MIEPGPLRTDVGGRSIDVTPTQIEDYVPILGGYMAAMTQITGTQPGDPVRAAEAIVGAYLAPNPPRTLVLGRATVERAEAKFRSRLDSLEQWRVVSSAADFPE